MKNSIIQPLFPIPLYYSNISRDFTKKELSFIKKEKNNYIRNIGGNSHTKNVEIFKNSALKNLQKDCDFFVKDYFEKVIDTNNNVVPYITQSWLNYTDKHEHHHKHNHWNSLISGVLYIDCIEGNDTIQFYRDHYETIHMQPKNYNLFNSQDWTVKVKPGDILLFPSSLSHMVPQNETDNLRISLSFNVWFKGKVGDGFSLTELSVN